MCCLFGFYNYSGQEIKNLTTLTNSLAEQATKRGTDAAGIAYVNNGKLTIHKEGKAANLIKFRHPEDTICVMAHSRHATHGNPANNLNNHPFSGKCHNVHFALAHNGVLMNGRELRKMYHLPYTRIETDSYIALQLLQAKTHLNTENIRFMAEKVDGSFAFSIVDTNNTLWLVRGDSPLSLVHLPKYKLYVYASTDEILFKALVGTVLFEEIKRGNFEEIEINSGDIFKITTDGVLTKDKFKYTDSSLWERCNWWTYGMSDKLDGYEAYINDLKSVVTYLGYSPDDVDKMLQSGFSPEEIEDFIYSYS